MGGDTIANLFSTHQWPIDKHLKRPAAGRYSPPARSPHTKASAGQLHGHHIAWHQGKDTTAAPNFLHFR